MNEMQRERFYRSHEAPCVMVLKRILFTIFGNFYMGECDPFLY